MAGRGVPGCSRGRWAASRYANTAGSSSFKQIANAGVGRICYGEFYRDERIFGVVRELGIELTHIPSSVRPTASALHDGDGSAQPPVIDDPAGRVPAGRRPSSAVG